MSVKSNVPQELKSWFKVFDQLCYRHDYVTVFDHYLLMLLNWFANAEFKEEWFQCKKRYDEKELKLFNQLYVELLQLMEKETNKSDWFDPFGHMYQTLASRGKTSKLGQFFTPEAACNMIALSFIPKNRIEQVIGDPACGSGRMLLAAHSVNRMNHYVAQDLDRMCCKMTAINMALHCMSGVVIHGNTLSTETCSYWAVSRVEIKENMFLPKINIITKEQYEAWHKEKLFISKWINPQKPKEFDEKETAEILEQFETKTESEPSVLFSGNQTDQSIREEVQPVILSETNTKNELPIKVSKKSKIIINPDPNQMSLF